LRRPLRNSRVFGKIGDLDLRLLSQLHQQSCTLEQHEKQIAHHTSIQTRIAWIQLFFGVVTTALLIYVAVLQFQAADRQATIADRQASLEYAKVAPQFTVVETLYDTKKDESVTNSFPQEIGIRILRGEGVLQSVMVSQEINISRVLDDNFDCIVRISNYFQTKPGNITDLNSSIEFQKIASSPEWFQDERRRDFLIFNPKNTLVEVEYKDLFAKTRTKRFSGVNGKLTEIPSGDFSRSDLYETVNAAITSWPLRIPGSLKLTSKEPTTMGCRNLFGLRGGRTTFF
jgi:hypothetical protein